MGEFKKCQQMLIIVEPRYVGINHTTLFDLHVFKISIIKSFKLKKKFQWHTTCYSLPRATLMFMETDSKSAIIILIRVM